MSPTPGGLQSLASCTPQGRQPQGTVGRAVWATFRVPWDAGCWGFPVLSGPQYSCDPVESSNNAGGFSGHMADSESHLGGQQMSYESTIHWLGAGFSSQL